MVEVNDIVSKIVMGSILLMVLVGVLIGAKAFQDSQYSYSCSTTGDVANGTANCYTYTTTAWVQGEEFANYTLKTNSSLSKSTLKSVSCSITSVQNNSNKVKIPASNWTEVSDCVIARVNPVALVYGRSNWTVNYTAIYSNLTSQSTYGLKENVAYNMSRSIGFMSNNFSAQLPIVGTMFGVALILSAIGLLAYGVVAGTRKLE